MLQQQPRQVGSDLFLPPAEEAHATDLSERLVGAPPCPSQRAQLLGILHRAEPADDRGGGLEGDARGRPLQRQHVRGPSPVADRHATLPREHRGDQLVGVVTVAPADHLLGFERLSGDGVEGELPLQLRHD